LDVRKFFGCRNLVTTTPIAITDSIKTTTKPSTTINRQTEIESKGEGTNENAVIIIIIVVVTVVAVSFVIIFLVVFAVIKPRGI